MSLIKEYITYHNDYKKQYGNKIAVLMQVGSFFEMYSVMGDGPDLFEISKLLNIAHTYRDKSKPESMTNGRMCGFQQNSLEKFLEILIKNDFIVIVYSQKISDQKVVTRYVSGMYTKSTYINNLSQSNNNYLLCLYLVNEDQKNSGPLRSVALSWVDLSTGEVYVHSAFSEKYDEFIALDEACRLINNVSPSEILIYYDNQSKTKKNENMKEYLCEYFNIGINKCRFYDTIDSKYKKIAYQNEFLKKIYPDSESLLSPIEQLDLEREPNVIISLCLLFDFVYDKINILLKNIKKPNFCFDNEHLILGNDALNQLDIFESQESIHCKSKYKSIFDIVDHTSTNMGQRYLRQLLSNPLTSKTKLNKMYDLTQKFMDLKIPNQINNYLDGVKDIERLARRMSLKMIKPCELTLFISSYESIVNIIGILNRTNDFESIVKGQTILKNIDKFIKHVNNIFDLEQLAQHTDMIFDKKNKIFQKGIHADIDDLLDNIDSGNNAIEKLRDVLIALFPKSNTRFGNANKVTVKHNDKDSYYLKLSGKNGKQLQEILKNVKTLDINSKKIKTSDLEFSYNKDTVKITIPDLTDHSSSLDDYDDQLSQLYKMHYLKDIEDMHNKFGELFEKCNEIITKIDYHSSCATLATTFAYCRPIIEEKSCGFINAKKLRHPLVERLINYAFTPNDICIGNEDLKGILLFGINSSGKSILMKSCGVALLLSQTGMFVPADSFTYSPYKSLFTRISGSDNIYKGQSSYTVELVEINSILKRSNEYSMVIGDEIARGTEHVSGTALVGSTIIQLSKLNPTFVFTTHLHDLMKIKSVTDIKNVKAFHLKVDYDDKSKALVYDRRLEEGSGETEYGLIVARYVIQDQQFNDQCIKIRNELLEQYDTMISGKVSRYCSDVYVSECSLCGKKENINFPVLESHHIISQIKRDDNGNIKDKKFMKMDSAQNIAVLCTKCHDDIHANKKEIFGYVKTSKGRKLLTIEEKK